MLQVKLDKETHEEMREWIRNKEARPDIWTAPGSQRNSGGENHFIDRVPFPTGAMAPLHATQHNDLE